MICHSSLLRALYLYTIASPPPTVFLWLYRPFFCAIPATNEKNKEKEYFICLVKRSPLSTATEIVLSQGTPNFWAPFLRATFPLRAESRRVILGRLTGKYGVTMVFFLFLCDLTKEERPLTKWTCLFHRCCVPAWEFYLCLFADDVVLFLTSPHDLQNSPLRFASEFKASA